MHETSHPAPARATHSAAKGKEKEMLVLGDAPIPSAAYPLANPVASSSIPFDLRFGLSTVEHPSAPTSNFSVPVTQGDYTVSHPPSENITDHLSRPPPPLVHDPEATPHSPQLIELRHPANNKEFLNLPAYDRIPGSVHRFGLYHEMVLTACTIVACNSPGYLSTSRDRDAARVDITLNPFLLPGMYYYHTDNSKPDELYPICRDFGSWAFPHDGIPSSWAAGPLVNDAILSNNWTVLSQQIKARDTACLVTGATESLTAAHVVNRQDDDWVCRICSSLAVLTCGISAD